MNHRPGLACSRGGRPYLDEVAHESDLVEM